MDREISIYLHLPFCRQRCAYCAFTSFAGREAVIPAYAQALTTEMAHRAGDETVKTIFLGGGTPSLFPVETLRDILDGVRSHWTVSANAEISLEANPGDLDPAYLAALRAAGFNRISLGVQSFVDRELKLLGRRHTAAAAAAAVTGARRAGFRNISLDLIYGLPDQNMADFEDSLRRAVALEPEHISLYALGLEDGTPLASRVAQGEIPAPGADTAADEYLRADEILAEEGYAQYEISNWAHPGSECRHNLTYWLNQPYLGLGVAAHSSYNHRRCANTADLDAYITALAASKLPPLDMEETIDTDLELAETLILGLRLNRGVKTSDIRARFSIDLYSRYSAATDDVAELGLLDREADRWRLTPHGRFLSNEVFWRLLPEKTNDTG
jgi:oxygen-independent coproporphyrinogen III oxidase